MNRPLISVIVPLYNKESTIERCLDSVFCQSFQDWELVIVDDGSTDNSSLFVEKRVNADSRVKLIRKPNGGVSSARNIGVKNASGEWDVFLDADDYFLPDAFDTFSKLINQCNTSVILTDFYAMDSGMTHISMYGKERTLKKSFKQWIDGKMIGRAGAVLFSHDVLSKHTFDESLSRFEDLKFMFAIMRQYDMFYSPTPVMVYTDDNKELSHRSIDVSKDFVFNVDFQNKSFWEKMALMHLIRMNIPTYPEFRHELLMKCHEHYWIFILDKAYSVYRRKCYSLRRYIGLTDKR